jgi:ATP-dependent Lon protease
LNLPFDLSQVVFIATANDRSTIPAPLLDRMELLEMPSYSSQQKFQIAQKHIIPRQLTEHALSPDYLQIQVTTYRIHFFSLNFYIFSPTLFITLLKHIPEKPVSVN